MRRTYQVTLPDGERAYKHTFKMLGPEVTAWCSMRQGIWYIDTLRDAGEPPPKYPAFAPHVTGLPAVRVWGRRP